MKRTNESIAKQSCNVYAATQPRFSVLSGVVMWSAAAMLPPFFAVYGESESGSMAAALHIRTLPFFVCAVQISTVRVDSTMKTFSMFVKLTLVIVRTRHCPV